MLYSCHSCSTHVVLVWHSCHFCRSCLTAVALVLLVSHSCCKLEPRRNNKAHTWWFFIPGILFIHIQLTERFRAELSSSKTIVEYDSCLARWGSLSRCCRYSDRPTFPCSKFNNKNFALVRRPCSLQKGHKQKISDVVESFYLIFKKCLVVILVIL